MFLPEVHAIGLGAAHGLYITDGFYWDENEPARTWSKRYFGLPPVRLTAA
jgi:branched-chain amino acid transport system substrate-binding protein